jgi:hypothetical protein
MEGAGMATKKKAGAGKVQFVHDTAISSMLAIEAYVHCGQCLTELPNGVSPKDWARTQAGFTRNGFQVWCTRHNVNVDHVEVRCAS